MNNWTPLFVALTGIAVALQAGILLAMYFAMRKSGERIEAIATELKAKMMPTVEQAQAMLTEIGPKPQVIAENLQESRTVMRMQVQRVDATVTDVVDRARLQVIRADELVTRTFERVEQTSDMVHSTVISPVRQISGLMQGITVGLEFLFGGRGRRNGRVRDDGRAVPQDEMFI